ncbi:Solute carrier family 35 member F6 [Lamellibrachia satsuma]|nr:Solute carrier family 35 member F6 [Lamellibrachia satsuma]
MASWTKYQFFLASMMLVTGSLNTLSTKWADNIEVVGIDDGRPRKFDHPFVQAVGMFLGELSCLLAFSVVYFYRKKKDIPMEVGDQSFNRLIFLPAAMLDMCGTSLMYVGLNLTFASSFQMLRGAVIIFTALLSVAFLRSRIRHYMWLGMLLIVFGLVFVGVSDVMFGGSSTDTGLNGIISGDLLIIMAQIIVATQMVYEQKFVMQYNVPALQAVGWEGFFGASVLGLLLIPMYYIRVGHPFSTDPNGRMENVKDAFVQMGNNWQLILAVVGNITSIAFFNFSGISVMKEMNATTRMVLDSCRTIVIWVVSLAVGWQGFTWQSFLLQSFGFLLLIGGTFVYNNVIFAPFLVKHNCLRPQEEDELSETAPDINPDERSALIS